jgi:hypothetical protein
VEYEYQPHFTRRSTAFVKTGGKIEPIVTEINPNDTVNPEKAMLYMKDLKAFAQKSSTVKLYQDRVEMWNALREALASGSKTKVRNLSQSLINHFANSSQLPMIRAAIADMIEIQNINGIESMGLNFTVDDVYEPTAKNAAKPYGKGSTDKNLSSEASPPPPKSKTKVLKEQDFESFEPSAGEKLKISDKEYEIVEQISRDAKYAVYELKNSKGERFIVKYATSGDSKQADDLEDEVKASKRIRKVSENYAAEVVEHDGAFAVKRFVKGKSGTEWLAGWRNAGYPNNTAVKQFRQMLVDLAEAGVYVGALTPEDMIYTGSGWVVINSGSAQKLSKADAYSRYFEKIRSRWSKEFNDQVGIQACELLVKGFND